MKRVIVLFVLLLFINLLLPVGICSATTYYVNDATGDDSNDGLTPGTAKKTIQAGLDVATGGGDTVIVADGTYKGTNNKDLDFGGYAITLQSENGAENCIIDCEGSGRGFYFHSSETTTSVVDGFTITNGNAPDYGGGIYCDNSSPTITNCIIDDNTASLAAGGIACIYSSSPAIINCTVSDNNVATGPCGGIGCDTSSPAITNCIISGNTAPWQAGGIGCFSDSSPTIANCTVSGNTAGSTGGGIYCSNSSPSVTNCILWDDSPGEVYVVSGSPTFTYCDIQGGYAGTGNIDADPQFVYADVGNFRLRPGSPCIDSGTSTGAPTTDMEGRPRYDDPTTSNTGGGTPDYYDIGAHEFKGWYVSTSGSDSNDGLTPATAFLTIQHALGTGANGDYIQVADGTYKGTKNKDLDFGGYAITLESENGAEVTIIDCEGSGRGFDFHSGEAATSVVEGFTIRNGNATYGGAIYCDYSSPTITNCIIINNEATLDGGGIECYYSSPSISYCTIENNSAGRWGGGIDCWNGDPLVENCTITENRSFWNGGGISCFQSSPTIANCTLVGNSAINQGGGIYCYNESDPVLTNCILWGDSPDEIYVYSGTPTVEYCDVQGGMGQPWFGTGCIDVDPFFLDPTNNNYRLLWESNCVDAGNNDAPSLSTTDLDGYPRIQFGRTSDRVDMGAYEFGHYFTLMDISRDSGGNIDVSWCSNGNGGVLYDMYYSDDAFSDAMTWSVLQSDISTQGSFTTYTDTSAPSSGHRYYRVVDKGTGVHSYDTVGIYWITLRNSFHSGMNYVATPLVPFDNSLDAVLGDQLSGSTVPAFADKCRKWDFDTLSYKKAYLWSDGVSSEWRDFDNPTQPATFTFDADGGYMLVLTPSTPDYAPLYFVGKVSAVDRSVGPLKSIFTSGLNYAGSSYPIPVSLDNSGLVTSGFTGSAAYPFSDKLWFWNWTTRSYDRVYYNTTAFEWRDYPAETVTTKQLSPGEGFRLILTPASGLKDNYWDYPKPYTKPPNN